MQGFMPELECSSPVDLVHPIDLRVSRACFVNQMKGSTSHRGHHSAWALMGYEATGYRHRGLLCKLRTLKSASRRAC